MAEYITSRIKQKTGTIDEWESVWNTFVPLKGEQCVIIIPSNSVTGENYGFRKSSSVRHVSKTGNGTSTVGNLPWDSDIIDIYQTIDKNSTEISKLSAQINTSVKVFIGSYQQYRTANSNGQISVGTLVFLTDEEAAPSSSSPAILGTAILGQMLLGTQ